MSFPRSTTYHPASVEVLIPEPFVVSYLATANGTPVTKATMQNAVYIRTEMFDCDDDAWSRWGTLTEVPEDDQPAFISCQDSRGESTV